MDPSRLFSLLPPEAAVILIAILPVLELRGAMPAGLAMGLNPVFVFILSIVGNMLPMPLVYRLLTPATRRLRSSAMVGRWFDAYLTRARSKGEQIRKYGFWGLVIFVGIPLPGTGAWTGVIAASLIGMRFWPTMLALTLGTLVAGVVVMTVSLLGLGLFGL